MKKLQGEPSSWAEKLKKAESTYNYQPKLTEKLDSISGDFDENTLMEIVLWKVNRYPEINQELLDKINDLRKSYSEEKGKEVLKLLLAKRGFALPMASTVLRFALPKHFQIIDQRVYRLITPDADKLKMPFNQDQQVDFYFKYLENLKRICKKYDILFEEADRILYEVDKIENKDIKLKY